MADTSRVPALPYHIEKMLYQFPEVVLRAATLLEPHRLVTYLTEVSAAFNHFYAEERIADASDEYAPYKLALTEATGLTLKNGLVLLGMSAPEEM
jgi:arginyl-tRNA synthetase